MRLSEKELSYLAALIDTHAIIRTRKYEDTVLPMVALNSPNMSLLSFIARKTGAKVTVTRRNYIKGGCVEHCPEKHQHIVSQSGRWSVSGAKATVLLVALRPYLEFQGYSADQAIAVGLRAPRKSKTASKMAALGWPLPDEWEPDAPERPEATADHRPAQAGQGNG